MSGKGEGKAEQKYDDLGRRIWDKEEFAKLAEERAAEQLAADEGAVAPVVPGLWTLPTSDSV